MFNNQSIPTVKSPDEISFELSSYDENRNSGNKKGVIHLPEKLHGSIDFLNEQVNDMEKKAGKKELPETVRKKMDGSNNYPGEKREELELISPYDKRNEKSQSKLNPETEIFTPRDPDETGEDPLKNKKYSDNKKNKNQPL